jgi:carboxylesterase type B
VDQLRFAAPEYPPRRTPPIPGPNPSCVQTKETNCVAGLPFVEDAPECFPKYYGTQSEDCLFLDVYVPMQAFTMSHRLPVVVWFYGGAFLFGSKTQYDPSKLPFYGGDGFVNTATKHNKGQNSTIYVQG